MQLDPQAEFDRQLLNLITKGYPSLLHMSDEIFRSHAGQLTTHLPKHMDIDIEAGKLPFVIVVKSPDGAAEAIMERVEREGKKGFSKMFPHNANDFHQIANVHVPEGFAYLLLDIDRGKQTLNVRPEDALKEMHMQNRSPLTIDEGIAVVTHYPEALIKNNCFSMLASRVAGNQRVPAIWINSEKRPNLGWCWDRNPHTWLGSASCKERRGIE